jgi:hypothetical protein
MTSALNGGEWSASRPCRALPPVPIEQEAGRSSELVWTRRLEQWYSTGGTRRHLRGYADYTICITCIMYKVEEKLYLGVREQKRLNTTGLEERSFWLCQGSNLDRPVVQSVVRHYRILTELLRLPCIL